MTAKSSTVDAELSSRCANILREKKAPMDCLAMSRLLREDSSAIYRAMCALPGIVIEGKGSLTKFHLK